MRAKPVDPLYQLHGTYPASAKETPSTLHHAAPRDQSNPPQKIAPAAQARTDDSAPATASKLNGDPETKGQGL